MCFRGRCKNGIVAAVFGSLLQLHVMEELPEGRGLGLTAYSLELRA